MDAPRRLGGMHGEAGGELIDADQKEIRNLVCELGLSEQRILRSGFAHYRLGQNGQRRMRSARSGWQATKNAIAPLLRAYKINEQEWMARSQRPSPSAQLAIG